MEFMGLVAKTKESAEDYGLEKKAHLKIKWAWSCSPGGAMLLAR